MLSLLFIVILAVLDSKFGITTGDAWLMSTRLDLLDVAIELSTLEVSLTNKQNLFVHASELGSIAYCANRTNSTLPYNWISSKLHYYTHSKCLSFYNTQEWLIINF